VALVAAEDEVVKYLRGRRRWRATGNPGYRFKDLGVLARSSMRCPDMFCTLAIWRVGNTGS